MEAFEKLSSEGRSWFIMCWKINAYVVMKTSFCSCADLIVIKDCGGGNVLFVYISNQFNKIHSHSPTNKIVCIVVSSSIRLLVSIFKWTFICLPHCGPAKCSGQVLFRSEPHDMVESKMALSLFPLLYNTIPLRHRAETAVIPHQFFTRRLQPFLSGLPASRQRLEKKRNWW